MAGRQWLALITRMTIERTDTGATTDIRWIEAHSDNHTIEHVGNRCADELAKRASSAQLRAGSQVSIINVPLEQEESWLAMREWDGTTAGRLVTADPRRHCIRKQQQRAKEQWALSKSQALFSSPDVDGRALWNAVRTRVPKLCAHVLRFLTDTAQWYRPADGAAERQCAHCQTNLSAMLLHVRSTADELPPPHRDAA